MRPHLSTEELAELSALADGSLPADRRAEVEARVAASPELGELVDRQRRALSAIRPIAEEPVPASLREGVEARLPASRPGRREGRGLMPRLALGAVGVVVIAAVAVALSVGGGGAEPTVADAAQLGTKPPTGPPPRRLGGNAGKLAIGIDGVTFPDLRPAYGWSAAGMRSDQIGGHDALVVFYAKGARRVAYVVVGGTPLGGASSYARTTARGVEFRTFSINGMPAVTWQQHGHTCVLTGTASRAELVGLASWRAGVAQLYQSS